MEASGQMSRAISRVKGTKDIFPGQIARWRHLEEAVGDVCGLYGFREIRTPMLEPTELFVRGVGEVTDIVEKEMYTFQRSEDSVSLRPEATAPVVRAYLEAGFDKNAPQQKLYYIGAMFRYERPQASRQRQFHQFGVEVLGSSSPLADAETIVLACDLYDSLGLEQYETMINSVGCVDCRAEYRAALSSALAPRLAQMCEDCNRRHGRNVFRMLDCKQARCTEVMAEAPSMAASLCEACHQHHAEVLAAVEAAGVEYIENPRLVRGLDYYTRTVYEITCDAIGARSTICGGGRYDGLIAELGGPSLGAVGFASGMEATLLALEKTRVEPPADGSAVDLFLILIGDEQRPSGFNLATKLRRAGVSCQFELGVKSPKAQMRAANRCGARFTLFFGPAEAASGRYKLRDLTTREEVEVGFEEVCSRLSAV